MPTLMDAWPALALMGLLVLLPWAVTWLRRQGWQGTGARGQALKVVGAVAVGPQQKVVTVEVTQGDQRRWLVLGVTPQSITQLATMEAPPETAPTLAAGVAVEQASGFRSILARQPGATP